MEKQLYETLLKELQTALPQLQKAAKAAASLDVLSTFARHAEERGYVCPEFADYPLIEISNGRHPVDAISSASKVSKPRGQVMNKE